MVETGSTGRPFPGWDAVAEDVVPGTDDTYDLGETDKRWAYLYAVIAILTSMTIGGIYLGATTDGWLFINASTQMNGSLAVNGSGLIWGNLTATGTAVDFTNANVTASYYLGDGSLLTGIQHGDLIFFLHNETSSDMPNSNTLEYEFNDTGASTILSTITSTDQQIKNFTTDSGIPGLQILPDGIAHLHFHAKKASGTKSVKIYYEYYIVFADNSTSFVATGEASDALTGSSVSYNIHSSHNETLLNSTDRLQVRLIAELTGLGSNPVIEIYIEGLTASRFELPGPVASTANFVPYTGAIRGLNLGSHNFTTTGYFVGDGSFLTDIDFTELDPYWTGNQSSYSTTASILGWDYWNDTYATFNKTYADTLYLTSYTETDPKWTGNSTLVPYLASANVFTANQNLTGINISAIDCMIFDTGGKICSGV